MLPKILPDNLHSMDSSTRIEAILGIATALEYCQLSLPRRIARLADKPSIGLSDQSLLELSCQKEEIEFIVSELTAAFVRFRDAAAIWAIGKAPIELAAGAILRLFQANRQSFDEEALWQAGCVIEVGLDTGAVPADSLKAFEEFLYELSEAETPRTQELTRRLRLSRAGG